MENKIKARVIFQNDTNKILKIKSYIEGFPGGSAGKESACNAGDLSSIPGWEDLQEKGTAAHSSILTWRIPWTV